VVTEEMVERAAKAVVAEWQQMASEMRPHMSVGDLARSFVSPGNYRLIRAALEASLSRLPVSGQVEGLDAQGLEAALEAWGFGEGYAWPKVKEAITAYLSALATRTETASKGEAVEPIAFGVFSKHGDLSGFGPTAADAEVSVDGGLWDGDYIAPLYAHPAPKEALLEEAVRVLEPFAECADEGNDDQPGDTKCEVKAGRSICYFLTLADLRAARSLAARIREGRS
jgi:hypothetical protein